MTQVVATTEEPPVLALPSTVAEPPVLALPPTVAEPPLEVLPPVDVPLLPASETVALPLVLSEDEQAATERR